MGESKKLHFELLGAFSCEGMALKGGRKVLSFLQYLIVHHERNISAEELIEEFWPERSSAPGSALRRMLFKTRDLLKERYPEHGELLLTLSGCYAWNPEVRLELDTERFESACMEGAKKEGEEQIEALLLAVTLYKGDFLSANDSAWVLGLRQYYRALYLEACRTLMPLLEKREKWIEILGICEQALRIDFAVEDFIVCQMQALISLGLPEQAMEKYVLFRNRMLEEFQTEPSGRVERMYTLAAGMRKRDAGIPGILESLNDEEAKERAFFCTFEMFKNIVALERRHLSRSKGDSALVVVRLGQSDFVTDMRRLERILLAGLRADDSVARLEAGSYILMLKGANVEKAQLVISRLDRTFHKTYRHSSANITYHISALSMEETPKWDPDLEKSNSLVTGDCHNIVNR